MSLGEGLLGSGLLGGEPPESGDETVFPLGFEILGGDFGTTVTSYQPGPVSHGVSTVVGTLGVAGHLPVGLQGSSSGQATAEGNTETTHIRIPVYVGVRVYDRELALAGRAVKSNTEDNPPTSDPEADAGGGWLSPRRILTTYWT